MDATYVRKDVWLEREEARRQALDDLRADIKDIKDSQRWIIRTLTVAMLTLLGNIVFQFLLAGIR